MTKTVYVVEGGAYSDKYVAAVFSNRDDANALAYTIDPSGVYELELDPELSEAEKRHIRPGEYAYNMAMDTDGNNAQAWETWREPANELWARNDLKRLSSSCWATSEQHAIKILNERRSAWLAAGKPMTEAVKQSDYWMKTGF